MEKTLEDYIERIGLFPSLVKPELLGSDGEFNYYKFTVPNVYVDYIEMGDAISDPALEEAPAALAMDWYPVHVGIEMIGSDADYHYYKVPVPHKLIESRYGIMYRPYQEW